MPFIGTPTIKLVADNLVRITGVSLAGADGTPNDVGTIGLFERTVAPDVRLPAAFRPRPYRNGINLVVDLESCIEVFYTNVVTAAAVLAPVQYGKSGTLITDFTITVTNTAPTGTSAGLEIYIRHH